MCFLEQELDGVINGRIEFDRRSILPAILSVDRSQIVLVDWWRTRRTGWMLA